MRRFRGKSVRRSRTSPRPASRRQGRFHAKERKRSRRRVTPQRNPKGSVSGAQGKVPLYERKPSRRIRDRSEARECFADQATLCQLSAESCESSKKTSQSRYANIGERCCLASFRRRTGCSPSRWRSRRHEHKNLLKFLRAVSQSARNRTLAMRKEQKIL